MWPPVVAVVADVGIVAVVAVMVVCGHWSHCDCLGHCTVVVLVAIDRDATTLVAVVRVVELS